MGGGSGRGRSLTGGGVVGSGWETRTDHCATNTTQCSMHVPAYLFSENDCKSLKNCDSKY